MYEMFLLTAFVLSFLAGTLPSSHGGAATAFQCHRSCVTELTSPHSTGTQNHHPHPTHRPPSRSYRFANDAVTRHRSVLLASSVSTDDAPLLSDVLVIGGTSGIGQLVTQKLANIPSTGGNNQPHYRYTVRTTSRSKSRGEELFPDNHNIQVLEVDLLQEDTTRLQAAMEGVSVVVVSVGTTAFPTIKWKGGNTPVAIDNDAVTRVAQLASQISSVRQVIVVTSIGVARTNVMPFLILNLFGVLDAKRAGEDAIRQYSTTSSGYQYSIVRPGRLVGGPFTNFDVAKLLQIQGGTENGVTLARGDTLLGDCKRDACAECIVQCIRNHQATPLSNLEFSIVSNDRPALNDDEWSAAFQSVV